MMMRRRSNGLAVMIKQCQSEDIERIYAVINEAARVYRGVIPPDCYYEPYMSVDELVEEMQRMDFFGWWEEEQLIGVMGFQRVEDVTLIRHSYVRSSWQRQGIGNQLLNYLKPLVETRWLLVGTWAAADWAITFYQKHGFHLLDDNDRLLRSYWHISDRQIETSVVLGFMLY